MIEINKIQKKIEKSVIDNIDRENAHKILTFLVREKCDFIEDIITDYIDLFSFEYNEFLNKYNELNKKYNGHYLEQTREDLNLLEEFYNVN